MNYHMGIDTHHGYSFFQHMDADGAIGISERIATNRDAIHELLAQLDDPTTITFEAGRNYWWLHELFAEHPMVSQVNVVDPRRSRKLASELSVLSGYGRAKNDYIDAEMLAEQTRRGLAPTIQVPTAEQLEPRTWCRHRFNSVMQRTRAKNLIHAILELHGFSAKIATLVTPSDTRDQFLALLPGYVAVIIEQFVARIKLLDQQIASSETRLAQLLPESHPQMKIVLSAPGFGPVLSRMVLSEMLDITYFKEPKYLISYAGLAPIANESAGRKGSVKLNKQCNHYLKYAFVEAAHNARDNLNYRRKYELDVKKQGNIIAKLNLARRLAKTVYWMLTRQQLYRR
ncbi:IS110 family transposase [candidate division KSB1 bacterium]|nr:IS110 family transposase [candidate division KSB1 bacterium]